MEFMEFMEFVEFMEFIEFRVYGVYKVKWANCFRRCGGTSGTQGVLLCCEKPPFEPKRSFPAKAEVWVTLH